MHVCRMHMKQNEVWLRSSNGLPWCPPPSLHHADLGATDSGPKCKLLRHNVRMWSSRARKPSFFVANVHLGSNVRCARCQLSALRVPKVVVGQHTRVLPQCGNN